jgi:DNA-binding NarL/FixJ family response regulator
VDAEPKQRMIVIDDHPVIASGLPSLAPSLEVLASYSSVEAYLAAPALDTDVVLLDLQLGTAEDNVASAQHASGTEAIRMILDAGRGPIVIYTSIAQEMLLAACLAAGAMGAAVKTSPGPAIAEVVRIVAQGKMWVDPAIAGALTRYAQRQHAGALSPQQANALRYRGQGLKQQAIAERIGVSDPEVVHRYLKSAVEKLADADFALAADEGGKHPGARIDELARRSGLASGLVRWKDLNPARRRRRPSQS